MEVTRQTSYAEEFQIILVDKLSPSFHDNFLPKCEVMVLFMQPTPYWWACSFAL